MSKRIATVKNIIIDTLKVYYSQNSEEEKETTKEYLRKGVRIFQRFRKVSRQDRLLVKQLTQNIT